LQGQFLANILSNLAVFASNILIWLWFIPYLIRNLGVASYGLIPLASSITAYLSIATLSLNGAVSRFLTIDLRRDDVLSANRTFNTSLICCLGVSILLLPFVLGFAFVSPRFFNIPAGQNTGGQLLFGATLGSFLVATIGSSFAVSSLALNRLDLRNIIIAASQLFRVGLVILLFSLTEPRLWHVGVGVLGAAVVEAFGHRILWRILTPQLTIMPSALDSSQVGKLFDMGRWLVLDQIGTLLLLNIDLVLVNRLLGAETGGFYGSVLLWANTMRMLATNVCGVLLPTAFTKYAQEDFDSLIRITRQAVKLLGLTVALPIGLLCGLSKPFLTVWLGSGFQHLSSLVLVLMAHLSINLAVFPLFGIQVAFGKVRWPAIVTFIMGIINVLLAVAFVKWAGWGAIGVGVAGALAFTVRNTIFTATYGTFIQKVPWWTFLSDQVPGFAGALTVAMLAYGVTQVLTIDSWTMLVTSSATIALIYAGLVFSTVFSPQERKFLVGLASRLI
jgi:membrane protein EpsK